MNLYALAHIAATAFLMGFAAAAPIGPVNMMAVRRGLLSGPLHTLACAAGAVLGDLLLFSLALWGGSYFLHGLLNGRLRQIMALAGFAVLLPFGVFFLVMALRRSSRLPVRYAHRHWAYRPTSAQLFGEGARAFLLTVLNPLTAVYWIGAASSWMPEAYALLGPRSSLAGITAAGAGMVAWYGGLTLFVSYLPHRVGAAFFRLINAALGVALLALAAFCAAALIFPAAR